MSSRGEMSHDVAPARHFIGGEFCDSVDGATFAVINPVTEREIASAARGQEPEVDRAVDAARQAFESGVWSRATGAHRREVLMRVADLVDARADEISALESLEMGRPLGPPPAPGARVAPTRAAWNFRFFAMEQELAGDHAYNRDDTLLTYTMADAAGVFGLITPWNGPFTLSTWKIAPCLAYGNSAVHKPSEMSPLSIRILGEIFEEAGLPAGVYNTVLGYGKEAGVPLVEHPDVIGVSFTGSPPTARDIATRVAPMLKRTSFELGGKSAMLIFEDADLDRAVPAAAAGIFANSGQACIANSRILVHRPIYDEFLKRFTQEARKWTVGDPSEPTTRLGPVVSKGQYERICGYLELAKDEGRILFGGGRPAGRDTGFFLEPTAIVDVDPGARVSREEIFGPVATVMAFDDADEALAIANDSSYGLAGYIWTADHARAHHVARRLQTGMIWINSGFDRDLRQPFGGIKQSGLGREGGGHSREFFTQARFVSFPLARG